MTTQETAPVSVPLQANSQAQHLVNPEQVIALVEYVVQRGLYHKAPEAVEQLVTAIEGLQRVEEHRAGSEEKPQQAKILTSMVLPYAKLAAATYPDFCVNGLTILSSATNAKRKAMWIALYLVVFLVLALFSEVLARHFGFEARSALNQVEGFFFWLHFNVLSFMSPLFWGGVGASVYLLKRIADAGAESRYDPAFEQSALPRIFLGAVLGFVVVHLFWDQVQLGAGTGLGNLTQAAVAFLCGLGVKAVYGIFEYLIDTISKGIQKLGDRK